METLRLDVPAPAPIDWARVARHLRGSSLGSPYRVEESGGLVRIARVFSFEPPGRWDQGGPLAVRLTLRPGSRRIAVEARAPDPARHPELPAALRALVEAIFSADHPLDDLESAAAGDPVLLALIRRFEGLRMVRAPSLFEALATAIVGQQVTVAFAQAVRRRLMAEYGPRLDWNGETLVGFPPAPILAAAPPADLRGLQISRQKAAYLVEAAAACLDGTLEQRLRAAPDAEPAIRELCGLRGVGRWTAEVTLMRGLGRTDVLPAADVGLQRAVGQIYGLPARPGESEVRALARRWRGWESYAALYLWESLSAAAG